MRCFDGFFMGNSLSDPRDLLIPFFGQSALPLTCDMLRRLAAAFLNEMCQSSETLSSLAATLADHTRTGTLQRAVPDLSPQATVERMNFKLSPTNCLSQNR
jgi:hypothetical protein